MYLSQLIYRQSLSNSIIFLKLHPRQSFDNLHPLHAQMHHSFNQIDNVTGIVLFATPVIRGIHNAAVLVRSDLIMLHNPFDCRTSIHSVTMCPRRNTGKMESVTADDCVFVCLVWKTHLCYVVRFFTCASGSVNFERTIRHNIRRNKRLR